MHSQRCLPSCQYLKESHSSTTFSASPFTAATSSASPPRCSHGLPPVGASCSTRPLFKINLLHVLCMKSILHQGCSSSDHASWSTCLEKAEHRQPPRSSTLGICHAKKQFPKKARKCTKPCPGSVCSSLWSINHKTWFNWRLAGISFSAGQQAIELLKRH